MDWYPRYPSLWRTKTRHLDPYQEGCYLRLIDEYMETRQPLPDNDQALARIIGISLEQWLGNASGIVRAFFRVQKGLLYNNRCDRILDEQDERAKKHSEKSKKGAEKRWNKNNNVDATGIPQALPDNATRQDIDIDKVSKKEPPIVPPENLEIKNARVRKRKSQTFIDPDYQPDFKSIALAAELGIDLEAERRKFINYWQGRGDSKADWDATFRNWIDRSAEYGAQRKQRETAGRPETRDVTGSALRAVEILRQRER